MTDETPAEPLNAAEEARLRRTPLLAGDGYLREMIVRLLVTLDAARPVVEREEGSHLTDAGLAVMQAALDRELAEQSQDIEAVESALGQLSGLGGDTEYLWSLGMRLDALLDELVMSGWTGEFDGRERAALAKLGYVQATVYDPKTQP